MRLNEIEMDNGWLLVEIKRVEKTKGGLFMPETHMERMRKGRILAIDPTVEKRKAGDLVLYDAYGSKGEILEVTSGEKDFKAELIKADSIVMKYGQIKNEEKK